MVRSKGLKEQVPLTAFFQVAGSSTTNTTRKSKKRRKSEALGSSPTVSPKKKAKLKQTLASSPTSSRSLRSSTKKSKETEEIPDSQEPELTLRDRPDYPYSRNTKKDSTPTVIRSTVQAKDYLPTPPDSHLVPPKRSWRDQDHPVTDDKGEGPSSVTRQIQSRSFQVPGTPTRHQGGPTTLGGLRGLSLASISAFSSPASTSFTRFIDPGDEVIPSSQTPPTTPRTPKRRRGLEFSSPTKIAALTFSSPSRIHSSPLFVHDRSHGEIIKSSQSQELSDFLSSPGQVVIPTSQFEEEELRLSSLRSPCRALPRVSPRMSTGLLTPSTAAGDASSISSRSSPLQRPSSRDKLIIPETQAILDRSQENSQSSVKTTSNQSQNLSSTQSSTTQLPFPSGQFPPPSPSNTNDTQMSDAFSQIDMFKQSWEHTPERLKHTEDPNATEPALPSLLPVLLSVKPQRIETFSQEDVQMHGSDNDSVTESEPSQVVNQVNPANNPSSGVRVAKKVTPGDDSETESETEDEDEAPPKSLAVSQATTEQQPIVLSVKGDTPSATPLSSLSSSPSHSLSPSPPAVPIPPTPSIPPRTVADSPPASAPAPCPAPPNPTIESQTQSEPGSDSQISDTPFSIPKDYDPSGVTTQELDTIILPDVVYDFLEMFVEGAQTPS
ncbi:hypothetical protein QCA50_000192 [Cerrena zonata]|uniref:Uncharacterized protein n=1 Tax=Cerrena zonata TaxID=2478898 RepID=A0AAW0GPZ8_9APHY